MASVTNDYDHDHHHDDPHPDHDDDDDDDDPDHDDGLDDEVGINIPVSYTHLTLPTKA